MSGLGEAIQYPTRPLPRPRCFQTSISYQGLPLEFGRMIQSVSDLACHSSTVLRVGIRSGPTQRPQPSTFAASAPITCKGELRPVPVGGPLPPARRRPAKSSGDNPTRWKRAAELGQTVTSIPISRSCLCTAASSHSRWYDAKDMRGTRRNDVNFAMDAPKVDSPLTSRFFAGKGAIIFAVSAARQCHRGRRKTVPTGPQAAFPETDLQYASVERTDMQPIRHDRRVPRGNK